MTKPPYADAEWFTALTDAVAATSQAAVAKRIGEKGSTLNQVLHGKYKGRVDLFAQRIEGKLLGKTVDCPGAGDEISRDRCAEYQQKPPAATNPQAVRIYHACRNGCANFRPSLAHKGQPKGKANDAA